MQRRSKPARRSVAPAASQTLVAGLVVSMTHLLRIHEAPAARHGGDRHRGRRRTRSRARVHCRGARLHHRERTAASLAVPPPSRPQRGSRSRPRAQASASTSETWRGPHPRAGRTRRRSNPRKSALPADRASARNDRKPWTPSCRHHPQETRPRTLRPMCIAETVTVYC